MDNNGIQADRNKEKHPEDHTLFGDPAAQDRLRQGLEDMYYLINRDYPIKASLALVGNRYNLVKRQLTALQGMSCSGLQLQQRKQKELLPEALRSKTIYIDGFNLLILLETAYSGGFVFKGLDGCYRDISSVHGAYKMINQTGDVLVLIGEMLRRLEVAKAIWIFDAPISNSGKLKGFCYELAEKHQFPWEIHLENSPDKFLITGDKIVCSSDAWILDECAAWFNMGAWMINNEKDRQLNIVDTQLQL
ncbi:DUF434 domain-containing protein [Chitinophaga filiformis]|uniref:DUF434 domain-containing protein n=1 Tax=Chitinophaga filiformis TaxID=104663 RepID=A0A1G7HRJ3_CHIFI|nr:DUF434 domain-containing protein [Chitinophaga filiformis]SDF02938.1 hypothetical protein SAMN04488121_101572 [Chitinophaga filiformis]